MGRHESEREKQERLRSSRRCVLTLFTRRVVATAATKERGKLQKKRKKKNAATTGKCEMERKEEGGGEEEVNSDEMRERGTSRVVQDDEGKQGVKRKQGYEGSSMDVR